MSNENKEVFHLLELKTIKEIVREVSDEITKSLNKNDKQKYDTSLRNTELLLINYRNLKEYVENAKYSEKQLNNKGVKEEEETVVVNAILKEKKRTEIMIEHIDNCIKIYENRCKNSKREDIQRRARVVKMLYINKKPVSYKCLAKALGDISTKTVERAKREAFRDLTPLFFRN